MVQWSGENCCNVLDLESFENQKFRLMWYSLIEQNLKGNGYLCKWYPWEKFGFWDHGLSYLDHGLMDEIISTLQGLLKMYLAKARCVWFKLNLMSWVEIKTLKWGPHLSIFAPKKAGVLLIWGLLPNENSWILAHEIHSRHCLYTNA